MSEKGNVLDNPPPHEPDEYEAHDTDSAEPERLALTLDIQEYLGQLEDWDISESQKREFIVAFWNLLVSIAEFNLGIHPAQAAAAEGRKPTQKCADNEVEKSPKNPDFPDVCGDNVLYSKPYYRTQSIEKSDDGSSSEESQNPS